MNDLEDLYRIYKNLLTTIDLEIEDGEDPWAIVINHGWIQNDPDPKVNQNVDLKPSRS